MLPKQKTLSELIRELLGMQEGKHIPPMLPAIDNGSTGIVGAEAFAA